MAVTLNSTGITYSDGTSESTKSIPLNSIIVFCQASAPTGYTQITTHNNKALRIVSGTGGGSGGSVAFSTAFSSQALSGTIGGFTLTTNEIPSHNHTDSGHTHTGGITGGYQGAGQSMSWSSQPSASGPNGTTNAGYASISYVGGGASHTHSFSGGNINLAVQYVDFIIAQKTT